MTNLFVICVRRNGSIRKRETRPDEVDDEGAKGKGELRDDLNDVVLERREIKERTHVSDGVGNVKKERE